MSRRAAASEAVRVATAWRDLWVFTTACFNASSGGVGSVLGVGFPVSPETATTDDLGASFFESDSEDEEHEESAGEALPGETVLTGAAPAGPTEPGNSGSVPELTAAVQEAARVLGSSSVAAQFEAAWQGACGAASERVTAFSQRIALYDAPLASGRLSSPLLSPPNPPSIPLSCPLTRAAPRPRLCLRAGVLRAASAALRGAGCAGCAGQVHPGSARRLGRSPRSPGRFPHPQRLARARAGTGVRCRGVPPRCRRRCPRARGSRRCWGRGRGGGGGGDRSRGCVGVGAGGGSRAERGRGSAAACDVAPAARPAAGSSAASGRLPRSLRKRGAGSRTAPRRGTPVYPTLLPAAEGSGEGPRRLASGWERGSKGWIPGPAGCRCARGDSCRGRGGWGRRG